MRSIAYLLLLLVQVLAPLSAVSQDTRIGVQSEQIDGPACAELPQEDALSAARPCRDDELHAWLQDAQHWRAEHRIRIGYDGREYDRPALRWTQSSFVQPQMMVQDRFFYDPSAGRYTVDRYLDDLDRRYGGIDSVLVWPAYPNIGIDDRNQYDLLHDLPGGISGIREFVAMFHRRGVKVLFPVTLWDQGTRNEGTPDAQAITQEVTSTGADGINGDTLEGIPYTFRSASDAVQHPMALEPELWLGSDEMLNWNNMSWGYWKYGFVPSVSRYKWIESRHMVNLSNRWAHDHTDDLQFAFFNGVGFESWENVWGIWNGMTPRDGEALRRVAMIERFGKDLLVSPGWEPFVPMRQYGVFASRWPADEATLWTIINRNSYAATGEEMGVPHRAGIHYYDLWSGQELQASVESDEDVLSFTIEPNGFGAVLAVNNSDAGLMRLLARAHELAARPLSSFSHAWVSLPQQMVPVAATRPPQGTPSGMSRIPAAGFLFRVNGIEIEGSNDEGVDVQYPGELSARRYHQLKMHIPAFWIDTFPVTNQQFKRFVDATHYRPADDHNFLRDWTAGSYPASWGDKPVTWVSLEDARAYAAWAGKRLPHEWEWQYAAQGTDGRQYPWGNNWIAANVPAPDSARTEQPPSDVHAHPMGSSPFGVQDLVGNVWQWTDEWMDEHTRAAILRGGSHYQPAGSQWYLPQAYLLSQHGKYLLMAPSMDRSASIGFRCVMDAVQ